MLKIQALMQILGGGFAAVYALQSMIKGAINIGGKHQPFVARYADEPGLFVFGVLFILALGIGCAGAGRQMWRKKSDVQ